MKKKYEIITGQKYNKLTAIKPTLNIIENSKCWLFKCDCGKEKEIPAGKVYNNKIKSCGCGQLRFKDLTGKKYGKLTVIKPISKNHSNNVIWLCLCECGNYTEVVNSNLGKSINSCGCLLGNKVDLKNKKFGKLLAIEHNGRNKYGKVLWRCLCDCGNYYTVNSGALLTGNTTSCGKCRLLIKENPKLLEEWDYEKNKDININNLTIGNNKKYWWICKKCKKGWESNIHNRNGLNSGCPYCRSSKGEKIFKEILEINNIEFCMQKTFSDCKYKSCLRFDFYLPKYNICIELQGQQHFIIGRYKDADKRLEKIQIRDQIKRDYCKKNNIKLIEIHYTKFKKEKIEQILKEEKILNV